MKDFCYINSCLPCPHTPSSYDEWEQEWQLSLLLKSLNLISYYSNRKGLKGKTIPWLYIYLPLHCHQPRMVPPLRRIWFWTFWQIEKDCVRGERGGGGATDKTLVGSLAELEQLRLSFPASLFTDWQFQMDCLRKQ